MKQKGHFRAENHLGYVIWSEITGKIASGHAYDLKRELNGHNHIEFGKRRVFKEEKCCLLLHAVSPFFYHTSYKPIYHYQGSKEKDYLIKIIDQIFELGDPFFEMILPFPFKLIKGDCKTFQNGPVHCIAILQVL